jgi:hypothetical protein
MKKILLSVILLSVFAAASAQRRATGLIVDDRIADKIPQKTRLLTRAYTSLPSSWSLKKYCPAIDNQGEFSTCVGWATGYAARTIAEAARQGWRGTQYITSEAFSPLFVYGNIKYPDTKNCNIGTNLESALKLLKNTGIVKKRSFDAMCVDYVKSSLRTEAAQYKIDDYFLLFGPDHTYEQAVNVTKKALVENCPVVISFKVYQSFESTGFDCWGGPGGEHTGYHAMCVVGYDDNKYGGAFLLMNSWSTQWGNQGYAWVRYKDYSNYTHDALELYLKPKSTTTKTTKTTNTTKTTKTTTVTKTKFSGNLSMKLSNGRTLQATLGTSNGLMRYRITESLVSGTRYRIYLGNNQPCYVYVFSGDQQNNVAVNFPYSSNISPALTYSSNDIALPGENTWLELDDTRGTDYLCVLFSKYSVNIESLLNFLQKSSGNFYEKVKTGFSEYLASQNEINFSSTSMSFNATTTGAMVPLIVEFSHR